MLQESTGFVKRLVVWESMERVQLCGENRIGTEVRMLELNMSVHGHWLQREWKSSRWSL